MDTIENLLRFQVDAEGTSGPVKITPDFRVAVQGEKHGGIHFIINADGHDSETLDLVARGNTVAHLSSAKWVLDEMHPPASMQLQKSIYFYFLTIGDNYRIHMRENFGDKKSLAGSIRYSCHHIENVEYSVDLRDYIALTISNHVTHGPELRQAEKIILSYMEECRKTEL